MKKFGLLTLITIICFGLMFGSSALAADKVKWRMGSTWTPAINLYHGDKHMIKYVKEMSGGDFQIQWFPSGSLMKAFEYFDACSKGVVEAVAAGRRAAIAIDRYLQGETLEPAPTHSMTIPYDQVEMERFRKRPRMAVSTLPVQERVANFREVELGFDKLDALKEADRCLQCGMFPRK